MTIDDIKGKRVKVVGRSHPHYGETGTIKDYKQTALGKAGLIIEVSQWNSFFVFDMSDIRLID